MNTPDWIQAIRDRLGGGWFSPFKVGENHPLIAGEWPCLHCNDPFKDGDVAVVMPFTKADGESVWVAQHRGCVLDQLGLKGLVEGMSLIENFYRGFGKDESGRVFLETLSLSDASLEAVHDWVQWVFPLPEASQAQPDSPVFSVEDLRAFREDTRLHARVRQALERFESFLRATETRWVRPSDHNHLRITRVLRFLTLIGLNDDAHRLYRYVGGRMAEAKVLRERTDWYWRTALKPTSEAWPSEWAKWAGTDSTPLAGKEE